MGCNQSGSRVLGWARRHWAGASIPRRLPVFYGWVIVAVAFVTMGLGVNARTAFSLLFPPILAEFGWERGTTAGAFSFGFLVSALLSPWVGRLMDRRGPRMVIEMGVGLIVAGLLLAPLVRQPWHLYATLGVLVGGGANCLGYTGQSLFLPNWFVRRRGLAMSLAFSGVGVGAILVLPWLQALIGRAGWRTACWALGLLVLALLAPLNLLLRQRPEDLGLAPDGSRSGPTSAADGPPANIVDAAWVAVDWTLGRAMRTARFWWIAGGYGCGLFTWYAVQVHQTQYVVESGFSATQAAWALGCVSLAGVPGQIVLGHVSDRIGREWVWTVGCLGFVLCALALLGLRHTPTPALLALMVIAQGLLGYGLTSVIGAIPAEIFQGPHYGIIFGTLMLAAIMGGAAGPWVTGALHDATGSYTLAFWIAIGCSVLSAGAIWLAGPRQVRAVAGRTHDRVVPCRTTCNPLRLRQQKEEHVMKIVTIDEAQTQLPALVAAVEATGEPVLICHQGKPVADLVPHRTRSRLVPHPVMQQIRIDYDPTEPLTADEWPEQSR